MANSEDKTTVLYEAREFLGPDTLDAFRAYVVEYEYPDCKDTGRPDRYFSAGFSLSEESQGHFCCTVGHEDSPADLTPVLHKARIVIRGLQGLVEAIEARQSAEVSE